MEDCCTARSFSTRAAGRSAAKHAGLLSGRLYPLPICCIATGGISVNLITGIPIRGAALSAGDL